MPLARASGGYGPPVAAASAPTVLGSALVAQNEDEGTDPVTLTMTGVATAGTLLSWVGILTANFAGPVTGNNGNTYTQAFSQAFPSPYTAYTIRGYRSYSAGGGSDHTFTVDKSSGAIGECTLVGLLLSGGSIVDSSVTQQDNAGAGHTFTSGSVTTTGPALLVAVASGDGDPNAVAPTQTWPVGWTVHKSVARTSSQDASGHIPFYLATKEVTTGTHTVDVQVTNDEGLILALYAVQ